MQWLIPTDCPAPTLMHCSTVFQNNEKDSTKVATILLRGSTNEILNDVERAIGTV